MSLVGRALVADSESDWSLESPLLAHVVACPDSESEIEQSDGAALMPSPQAESQPRQGWQRPGEQPKGGDHWEIWIQNEKGKIRQRGDLDCTFPPPDGVSIFKVPSFLKVSTKREAYVPKIVSLGPYHHGHAKLTPIEIHKERALRRMMTRINNCNPNVDFFRAVANIFQEKDEIMNSYEKKYDSNVENYLALIIRDGCFILEIMRTLGGDELPGDNVSNCYEPIFEENKIENTGFDILNDMMKLENQIPLIFLQSLLELENSSNDVTKFLAQVIVSIVPKFYPFHFPDETSNTDEQTSNTDEQLVSLLQKLIVSPPECRHLLALLHSLIVFQEPDKKKEPDEKKEQQVDTSCILCIPCAASKDKVKVYQRIPCAVELKKAGIKFQKSNSGGIGNIKFENGTIHLPPITITDHTEVLFRNLVALELCNPSKINYVICYVTVMDELINSGEDVAVLRKNEIVTHYLGSDEEVAKLFNDLCTGVNLSSEDVKHLKDLKQDVNKHYNNKTKVHFAQFVSDNFSSPWKALALVGAVIALVLTLVQTIFAILAVIN